MPDDGAYINVPPGYVLSNALVPDNTHALEELGKVKSGDYVNVEFKRPRNPFHHKKLFALLGKVYENQTKFRSIDQILTGFKFAVGHTETIIVQGKTCEYPKSIAFASMNQSEFEEFYDRVVAFIVSDVLPGVTAEELENEVLEMIS